MTLTDIKALPVFQTRSISEAAKDPGTKLYLITCLNRFYMGDYGIVPPEDTEANNNDLLAGEGHILAKYPQSDKLTGSIYIEAHFYDAKLNDIDYSNVLIMYPEER